MSWKVLDCWPYSANFFLCLTHAGLAKIFTSCLFLNQREWQWLFSILWNWVETGCLLPFLFAISVSCFQDQDRPRWGLYTDKQDIGWNGCRRHGWTVQPPWCCAPSSLYTAPPSSTASACSTVGNDWANRQQRRSLVASSPDWKWIGNRQAALSFAGRYVQWNWSN